MTKKKLKNQFTRKIYLHKLFDSFVLYVAYFIGMLALLIPVILYDYGTIKNPIWQLVATVWLIISLFLTPLISIEGNAVIVGLNKSNLLMALIFLEYAYIAITTWGYKFYFNLKISNRKLQ